MGNLNLNHVTIFSLYLSFTVYYFYSKMRSFTPLSFVVNVIRNLSNELWRSLRAGKVKQLGFWIKRILHVFWMAARAGKMAFSYTQLGISRRHWSHMNTFYFGWHVVDWPGLSGQNGQILAAFFLLPMGLALRFQSQIISLDVCGNWIRG